MVSLHYLDRVDSILEKINRRAHSVLRKFSRWADEKEKHDKAEGTFPTKEVLEIVRKQQRWVTWYRAEAEDLLEGLGADIDKSSRVKHSEILVRNIQSATNIISFLGPLIPTLQKGEEALKMQRQALEGNRMLYHAWYRREKEAVDEAERHIFAEIARRNPEIKEYVEKEVVKRGNKRGVIILMIILLSLTAGFLISSQRSRQENNGKKPAPAGQERRPDQPNTEGQQPTQPGTPQQEQPPARNEIPNPQFGITDFFALNDQLLLTYCLFGEARGCHDNATTAVANVIQYRLLSRSYPDNVRDVIVNGGFECFTQADNVRVLRDPRVEDTWRPAWERCYLIAWRMLRNRLNFVVPYCVEYRDDAVGHLQTPYDGNPRVDTYMFVHEMRDIRRYRGRWVGHFRFYTRSMEQITENILVNDFLFVGADSITIDRNVVLQMQNIRNVTQNPVTAMYVRRAGTRAFTDSIKVFPRKITGRTFRQFAGTIQHENGLFLLGTGNANELTDFGNERQDEYNLSLYNPLDTTTITSPYGWRVHPVTGDRREHRGIDLRARTPTPVFSSAHGQVERVVQNDPLAGNFIEIRHANGYLTRYLHMSRIDVRRGQRVDATTQIGLTGATGRIAGPHLHFGVMDDTGRYVNPERVFTPADDRNYHIINFQ